MKRTSSVIFFMMSLLTLCFAQETYNLEVIFKRSAWDVYPNLYDYGISLAGGDINNDNFSDIVIGASHWVDSLSWWAIDIYVFFGAPVMDTFYDAVLHCPPHFGHNGSAVWIGDLNGDSIGDVVVGDLGGVPNGEVRIYFGGVPFDTTVDMVLHETNAFGCSVSGGDVNGDSATDLIVGAYTYPGINIHGRVYIYYGGALLDTLPDVIIEGHNDESMGITVGSGGDVNDDGCEDIVVGAFNNSEAGTWAGKVYVFHGGDPMNTTPDCWMHGENGGDRLGLFGCDILAVENNYDMVITSTRFCGGISYGRGKVYILYGGDPMDSLPDIWMIGETDSSSLGRWCCNAGDVDGDGNDDALVGAPNDYGHFGCGYIWLGGMPMDREPDAYLKGAFSGQGVGWKVASAGDINGNGQDEVMFSNYAGVDPMVWVCKYTGPGILEYDNAIKNSNTLVSPNPFADVLKICLHHSQVEKSISISIYDVVGREVMSNVIGHQYNPIVINTELLSPGIYFVHITHDGESIIIKVVKTK